jgi:catechol 1,2-dioxygenase
MHMSEKSNIAGFTEQVVNATSANADPRSRLVMAALIRHLHAFVLETSLTLEELLAACSFMVRAGKMSDEVRDEFVLMANILGVEVLVDMISRTGTDQTTVLGPMYMADAPSFANGSSIVSSCPSDGQPALIEGYVRDEMGVPIAGATLDVWQASTNGLYDVQDPEQPDGNLRGKFTTDETGYYALRALRPTSYPIPVDGPGGELLRMLDRHPMRPAHIHFIVSAPGKNTIISQLYDADCAYLEHDAIFAVKDALVLRFEAAPIGASAEFEVRYDWILVDEPTVS